MIQLDSWKVLYTETTFGTWAPENMSNTGNQSYIHIKYVLKKDYRIRIYIQKLRTNTFYVINELIK